MADPTVTDAAVLAGLAALNKGPSGLVVYEDEVRTILAAAVPVVLAALADEIELIARREMEMPPIDFDGTWPAVNAGRRDAASMVRPAAEQWSS